MRTQNNTRRAGYQGQHDVLRAMADRLMNHPGEAPDVILSQSAPQFEKRRPYKKGGSVKNQRCQTFAAGGVAKIRHQEANAPGSPRKTQRKTGKG